MELARRMDLPVARTTMVEFQEGSAYRGRSLLVERYDVPDRLKLDSETSDARLFLQEDACSLLLLRREQKYNTSMERIADALLGAGVAPSDLRHFLMLVMFSWIVGNGDLHAKNVSILRRFRTGRPGEPPVFEGAELAPFYDLVNTRLHIPDDQLAVPVDGRRSNIRLRSFAALASRWDMPRDEVRDVAETLIQEIRSHLDPVLSESSLPQELQDQYRAVVRENVRTLGG
jgi:serine/threonine-protein kinase HipA